MLQKPRLTWLEEEYMPGEGAIAGLGAAVAGAAVQGAGPAVAVGVGASVTEVASGVEAVGQGAVQQAAAATETGPTAFDQTLTAVQQRGAEGAFQWLSQRGEQTPSGYNAVTRQFEQPDGSVGTTASPAQSEIPAFQAQAPKPLEQPASIVRPEVVQTPSQPPTPEPQDPRFYEFYGQAIAKAEQQAATEGRQLTPLERSLVKQEAIIAYNQQREATVRSEAGQQVERAAENIEMTPERTIKLIAENTQVINKFLQELVKNDPAEAARILKNLESQVAVLKKKGNPWWTVLAIAVAFFTSAIQSSKGMTQ